MPFGTYSPQRHGDTEDFNVNLLGILIEYKGLRLNADYRLDFVVEDKIIIELKSVENLMSIHEAQLPTYLKLTNKKSGLHINFNVPILKNGIKRIIL
jgi:GxxExxY protein